MGLRAVQFYVISFSQQPQDVDFLPSFYRPDRGTERLSDLLASGRGRIVPRWIMATWSCKLKELFLEASSNSPTDLSSLP